MNGNHYTPQYTNGLQPTTGSVLRVQPQFQPIQQQAPVRTTVRNPQLSNVNFTQGYLSTQIGRNVKIEFLIGTNMFVDREGTLMEVGVDYLIIQETETDDLLLCDMYSIKFVKFFY